MYKINTSLLQMIVIINVEEEQCEACLIAIGTANFIGARDGERGDKQDTEAERYHREDAGIYDEERSGNLKINCSCLEVSPVL